MCLKKVSLKCLCLLTFFSSKNKDFYFSSFFIFKFNKKNFFFLFSWIFCFRFLTTKTVTKPYSLKKNEYMFSGIFYLTLRIFLGPKWDSKIAKHKSQNIIFFFLLLMRSWNLCCFPFDNFRHSKDIFFFFKYRKFEY